MSFECTVGSILSTIVSRLWDSLIIQVTYPFNLKSNILKILNFKERLEARREDINMGIQIAERRQQICKHEVKEWLQRVEMIKSEIEELKDAYEKRGCLLGHCSLNMTSNHKLSKRALNKLQEAVELYDRGVFEVLALEAPSPKVEENPISSTIIGMEKKLNKILDYLRDDKNAIIGIWGMGGVGKTTLLKNINNYYLTGDENSLFDHVVCITASKGCKPENLQIEIANKVGLYLKHDSRMESHTSAVFNFMKKKRFLFLLDDLWEQVDLERIGVPQPNPRKGQKIVLATRFEEICGNMMAQTKIKLSCLGANEAWDLFKINVGEEIINFDMRIHSLATNVCEECSGLPLALISIGRVMSTRRTLQEWENAATSLKNAQLHEILGMNDMNPILSTLKFSYDSLENNWLKECFLTCAFWPKGYSIWNVELVDCWIGLGLLPLRKTIHDTYNEGYYCIERLKKVCLLEDGDKDTEVCLHDVIRDMALWILSEIVENRNWIVESGENKKQITKHDTKRWACAKRISLMCNYLQTLPHSLDCPNLSFLMLQQNFHLKAIPQIFFQNITSLSYLDLSWTPIKELPRGIGSLVKLQYLNLTKSDIASIPVELGCLTQLRFLNLSYTNNLKKIPKGVISKLSLLQVLNLFQSSYSGFERIIQENDVKNMENINNEFKLEELHNLERCLKSLGISVRTVNTLNILSKFNDIYLYLFGVYELKGESKLYLPLRRSIKVVNIKKCFTLEELFFEREEYNNFPPRLEYLTFWRLHKLRKVNLSEQLLYLRSLKIIENNNLNHLTWILNFPFLDHLDLSFCSKLKLVIDITELGDNRKIIDEGTVHALPKLRTLLMNHLPVLEKFSSMKMVFPLMEYMDVYQCPLLKEIPFETKLNSNLRQIRGEKEWWDSLEWDHFQTIANFQRFFRVFENNIETFDPSLETNPFMSSTGSFFARREPMMRIALQFSSYLSMFFGAQNC